MEEWRVLKLDSSYRPVQVISWQKAFSMVYSNRANIVEVRDDEYIRSAYESFPVPCVIAAKRYVNKKTVTLKCNRRNVFWRDAYTCQYCNTEFEESDLTLDHVTPKSKGGPKTWENMVTCCHRCNQKKGDRLAHESGMIPIRTPAPPGRWIFQLLRKNKIHEKWLPYLDSKGKRK